MIDIAHTGDGSIGIILGTSRNQVVNPDVGECFGLDARDFDILVVKSTNHFYGGFAPIASELCYVNTGLLDGMSDPRTPSIRVRRPTRSLSRPI